MPGKASLGLLVTKENCSLEHIVSRVCRDPGRAADPSVGQLFIPGKQKVGGHGCCKVRVLTLHISGQLGFSQLDANKGNKSQELPAGRREESESWTKGKMIDD